MGAGNILKKYTLIEDERKYSLQRLFTADELNDIINLTKN